jgi:DNA-directed DNA polymerase III PolC
MLLNVHSYYSLRYGTLSIPQLIEEMMAGGYDTAVLTDINNSSGVLDFIRLGREVGLNPLAGMEFRASDELLYIGIALNEEGFRELNACMTEANRTGRALPARAPQFQQAAVVYPYGRMAVGQLAEHEYIGVRPAELNKIINASPAELARYVILAPVTFRATSAWDQALGARHGGRPAHYGQYGQPGQYGQYGQSGQHGRYGQPGHQGRPGQAAQTLPEGYKLHTQLRAIEHNVLISQLQAHQVASQEEVLIPRARLMEHYKVVPELIRNTNRLLAQCTFDFDFTSIKNKETFTGNRYDDRQLLTKYAMDGFARRYGKQHKQAKERILNELDVIDNLNFSSYFLITDDICRYARSRDFYYVGRGSGANSIVAYCLGITDVCPIELNLYFERFLNPKRNSPPDFDVDFSWDQRDEVYDYIFKRYRSGHTGLMGAMSTFKGRSMIRELGKVYGLPKAEIDRMVHEPQHLLNKNEVTNLILSVCDQLKDFPNQRTIHASGVLISERPLTYYSALDYPPKGLPTVQYDMHVAEEIGFEKFDILSQRGIGHIKDARALVERNRGEIIRTDQPKRLFKDPKIAEQLRSANTIGCFYIESPAMRQLLTKLRCDEYLTLVAASSIIRPGVASSGMMKAYIERHLDPSKAEYPHPVFKEQLEETYGVMVYQEDVMKIGHHYGGLDLADADVLRRMMSGKHRKADHLLAIQDKFFDHCRRMKYPEDSSKEIWRQMESFAGYSFNKAHSASFAVESYQSLFLKTYYPKEFMVAVLNNYGGFYSRKVYVNEARRAGANIHLPCVNKSVFNTTIYGDDIYLGFDGLLHLEARLAHLIPAEREDQGAYRDLEQFVARTGVGLEQLIVLIRAGAFRFTGRGKKELLWEAHLLLSGQKQAKNTSAPLFEQLVHVPALPELESSSLEDLYDEIELLGFPVSGSMFDLARSDFRGDVLVRDIVARAGKEAGDAPQSSDPVQSSEPVQLSEPVQGVQSRIEPRIVRMVGDFVCDKDVRTKNGERMKFGTFFDAEGAFFDTVHFPATLSRYPLRGSGLYLLEGKIVWEFGCPALEVTRCGRMPLKQDPRSQ